MTTNLNKRERKAQQLLAHYDRCAALARHLGMSDPDGKKISVALFKIERDANNAACAQCNGESVANQPYRNEEQWEAFCEDVRARVERALGAVPPAFFYNADPRGYSLKIDNEQPEGKVLIETLKLHTDWGGYGILSPEITGN